MAEIQVSVQTEDFDVGFEYLKLKNDSAQDGAIVFFVGQVRDMNLGEAVSGLYLEHYPGMTEASLKGIAEKAAQRWPVNQIRILHRVGQLQPKDQIVFVATSSPHRQAAYEANEFVMDYLKTQAPFWKKETGETGEKWLDARETDYNAIERWVSKS